MTMHGDSGALRSNINAQHQADSGPNDYPDQAHHLLSSNVLIKLDKKYAQLAENAEYDLNRGSNGLLMPTNYGHQKHPNLQRHRGGHSKDLYEKVRERVEPIYELYEGTPCEDEEGKKNILGALTTAETDVKNWLKNCDWELYSNSKVLFDRDYRDEGVGDLSIDGRPAFTDKASALKWLEDKAVGLKRRYTGDVGKEVVRHEFYKGEGYPVPGDPRA